MRRERIGARGPWAVLLGVALCLGAAGPAGAVSFNNTDLFILPLQGSEPLDATLQDPAIQPRKLSISRGDYTVSVSGTQISGPSSPLNWSRTRPSLHNLTFSVRWNGTVGGVSASARPNEELWFILLELRFGTGSFAASSDLAAGYVRSTFAPAQGGEFIIFDATGGSGLISDVVSGDRYLGVRLPAVAGQTHTIRAQMLVAQPIRRSGRFQHFNNAFLAIPEPASVLLMAGGLLGLAALGRRRRA